MLLTPLDEVMGSVSKVRALRVLFRLDSQATGREIERLAGIKSRVGLLTTLNQLVAIGIVLRGGSPSTHMYRVNVRHHLFAPLSLLFEAESQRIAALGDELRIIVGRSGAARHLRSLIAFGGGARGEDRPGSDLDLLAIVDDERSVARIEDVLLDAEGTLRARFGITIAPCVLAADSVRARYGAGDPLMLSVETDGRTLLGADFDEIIR